MGQLRTVIRESHCILNPENSTALQNYEEIIISIKTEESALSTAQFIFLPYVSTNNVVLIIISLPKDCIAELATL